MSKKNYKYVPCVKYGDNRGCFHYAKSMGLSHGT